VPRPLPETCEEYKFRQNGEYFEKTEFRQIIRVLVHECINFQANSLSRDFIKFMSFLPPSTIFGRSTRRSVFHWSWLNTRHVRCMSHMAEAHAESLVKQTEVVPTTRPTFESLGLGAAFIHALQRAYPNAKYPTDTQAQLIPAILGTQDILVKDVTGSGKCVVFDLRFGVCSQLPLDQVVWVDAWTYQ
jgi:hypothetical protein